MIYNFKQMDISIIFRNIMALLFVFLLCSCATSHRGIPRILEGDLQGLPPETLKKIKTLQHDLAALGSKTDPAEAKLLAETGILYSLILANEYRLFGHPHIHNILVNIGLKERGLCFEWAEDLLKQFKTLDLKTFNLHEAVADKGKKFREHNTIVVTAKGKDFFEGIVLDPWRDSGRLYWISVKEDKYHWEKRENH
jgi:hypothetical protein